MSENGTPVVTPADLANAAGGAPNVQQVDSIDDLPQWAQKEIRSLRQEAADKRTRASALEAEVAQARNDLATKEAAFASQLSDSAMEQARYRAAVTSGVPADRIDDFASRLRGSTPDELAADAAHLAQLFQTSSTEHVPAPGFDPSQGLGNGRQAPVTPAAQLAEWVSSQRSR